jgi:hypothetical protein
MPVTDVLPGSGRLKRNATHKLERRAELDSNSAGVSMFIATTEGSFETAWMAEAESVDSRKISVIRDAFPKADTDKSKPGRTSAAFRRLSNDKTISAIAAGLSFMVFVL